MVVGLRSVDNNYIKINNDYLIIAQPVVCAVTLSNPSCVVEAEIEAPWYDPYSVTTLKGENWNEEWGRVAGTPTASGGGSGARL